MEETQVISNDVKKEKNTNSRINYLDFLKVIAIFFVVFVHYPWIDKSASSNISMIATTVAVPLFFMVNGVLILNKEFNGKKHLKKILYIILGIIMWKLVILGICLITQRVNIEDFSLQQIFNYFFGKGNLTKVPANHLWFMYSLLKMYIVFPFIKLASEKNKKNIKYIMIFLFVFSFGLEFINTVFIALNKFFNVYKINVIEIRNAFSPMTTDLNYIFYFLLGFVIHKKFYGQKLSKKDIGIYIVIFMFGLGLMILARYIQVGSFVHGSYQRINNDYSKIGNLLMSTSIFLTFCKLNIKENKIIEFIGKRTINIYYVHMIIVAYFQTYLSKVVGKTGVIVNFIRTIVVILICIIITEILKKIKFMKKILNLS